MFVDIRDLKKGGVLGGIRQKALRVAGGSGEEGAERLTRILMYAALTGGIIAINYLAARYGDLEALGRALLSF